MKKVDRSRAFDAIDKFWRAAIRWHLSSKSHRKPTDTRVLAALAQLSRNRYVSPLLHALQYLEHQWGKSYASWTTDEHSDSVTFVTLYFDDLRHQFERPPYRPQSMRSDFVGLVKRAMGWTQADERKAKRSDDRKLAMEYTNWLLKAQLFDYAKKQVGSYVKGGHSVDDAKQRLGSFRAVTEYLHNDLSDVRSLRPKGANLDEFLKRNGLEPTPARKRRIYRTM